MHNIVAILLFIAGLAMALSFVVKLVAFVRCGGFSKVPQSPPPQCKCPACGSEQIEVFLSGLWDGEDSVGRGTGGGRQVGTCKSCGVPCEHYSIWDNDSKQSRYESRVLTDEEWERQTALSKKLHHQQAEWPFVSGDQNHLTS